MTLFDEIGRRIGQAVGRVEEHNAHFISARLNGDVLPPFPAWCRYCAEYEAHRNHRDSSCEKCLRLHLAEPPEHPHEWFIGDGELYCAVDYCEATLGDLDTYFQERSAKERGLPKSS